MIDEPKEEKEKDHPLSGHLELRDFLSKLLGEDLVPERCEQWLFKRKRRRRRIDVEPGWYKSKGQGECSTMRLGLRKKEFDDFL